MKSKVKDKIQTTIYLEQQTLEDFKIYCIKNKVSMTEMVDKLIKNQLEQKEREKKESAIRILNLSGTGGVSSDIDEELENGRKDSENRV